MACISERILQGGVSVLRTIQTLAVGAGAVWSEATQPQRPVSLGLDAASWHWVNRFIHTGETHPTFSSKLQFFFACLVSNAQLPVHLPVHLPACLSIRFVSVYQD